MPRPLGGIVAFGGKEKWMTLMTRFQIKQAGGKLIKSIRHGEVQSQTWRLPDGTLYSGDDWYSDVQAKVYKVNTNKESAA